LVATAGDEKLGAATTEVMLRLVGMLARRVYGQSWASRRGHL